jgi:two-component system nitrate/nitrite response regulator NarL
MLGDAIIRVLVADGSRMHTQLLVEALRRDPELAVHPFEPDAATLLTALQAHDAEVLLMSSTLDECPGRGFELLREIRSSLPTIRAVMLLESSGDEAVLSAFRAGARGIVSRTEPVHILNLCIRRVHQGQIWADHRQMTIAIEALAAAPEVRAMNAQGMSLLSRRELQIVRSLAEGLTNREIAERLKLSQHTVKNYLFRVFDKLGVSSRVELLFMTLASSGAEPARKKSKPSESAASANDFGLFLQSTESGLPLPQVALAQMYVCLQKDPRDVVGAYAWYLLAADCGNQIKTQMEKGMTARQIEEAQGKAKSWLARMNSSATLTPVQPVAKPPRPAEGVSQSPSRLQNEKAKAASQS